MRIKFFSDYNIQESQVIRPKEYHIPSSYYSSNHSNNWKYDYAIITVEEELSSDLINFDLGVIREGMSYSNPVYVVNPDQTKTVIAIHRRGFNSDYECQSNQGIRITPDILNFIYNNCHLG